jgi:hypothetical protein
VAVAEERGIASRGARGQSRQVVSNQQVEAPAWRRAYAVAFRKKVGEKRSSAIAANSLLVQATLQRA